MRVLDTYTGQFVEIDPRDQKTKYAILSHTWDRKGEQTYQELSDIQKRHSSTEQHLAGSRPTPNPSQPSSSMTPATPQSVPPDPSSGQPLRPIWADPELSPKIREACRVAREEGYQYLWIDSCCIDKTSSSELSESINSMYQWYACAHVCHAFLPDVPAKDDHQQERSRFRRSRWFTRGWTLQELIAPVDVVFLAEDWTVIGSKDSLADLVTEITNISYNALLHIEPLDDFSVAQRLSWAANRETTRVEDRAYSLLGIFDINMPTLYGEGKRAFRRLQEEIMRRTPDQSLFAWTSGGLPDPSSHLHDPETFDAKHHHALCFQRLLYGTDNPSLLAPSPDVFSECAGIDALSHDEVARLLKLHPDELPATDYDFTPYGIRVQLPVILFSSSRYFPSGRVDQQRTDIPLSQWYLVILGCTHRDFPGHLLGRVCYTQSSGLGMAFLYSGSIDIATEDEREWFDFLPAFDLLPVSPATITRLHSSQMFSKTLHIPQPRRDLEGAHRVARQKPHETIKLVLPKKTCDALSAQGYTATVRGPLDHVHPPTHLVTLSHDTHTITIDFQHTLEGDSNHQRLTIGAQVKMSGPILRGARGYSNRRVRPSRVDGPGTQVSWTDAMRLPYTWRETLDVGNVQLNMPGSESTALTARLGLTFATKNHYFLHIEVDRDLDDLFS